MSLSKCLLAFSFFVILLGSCDNTVDVNAEWKEITVVYGMLNPEDSVQYIKINKAFLNENQDAEEVAQKPDSLYHNNDIRVRLLELKDGAVKEEISLQQATLDTKEPGLFPFPNHILYKTPKYQLNANRRYKLVIDQLKQNKPVTATTPIVKNITLDYPKTRHNLNFGDVDDLPFNWGTGENAFFYHLQINTIYTNVNTVNGNTSKDTVEWVVFEQQQTNSTAGGRDFEYEVPTQDFFQQVAAHVQRKNDIIRPVDSMYAEVIITGGAREIFNYLRVNEPSISLVQKKPEYTNVNNGRGIFSSATPYRYKIKFSDKTIDSLILGRYTKNLGFTNR